jgi:hypothetical protein
MFAIGQISTLQRAAIGNEEINKAEKLSTHGNDPTEYGDSSHGKTSAQKGIQTVAVSD